MLKITKMKLIAHLVVSCIKYFCER